MVRVWKGLLASPKHNNSHASVELTFVQAHALTRRIGLVLGLPLPQQALWPSPPLRAPPTPGFPASPPSPEPGRGQGRTPPAPHCCFCIHRALSPSLKRKRTRLLTSASLSWPGHWRLSPPCITVCPGCRLQVMTPLTLASSLASTHSGAAHPHLTVP